MTVRVPATSANLGPGFDVMGLALSLHCEVGVIGTDVAPEDAQECEDTHPAQVAFIRAGGRGRRRDSRRAAGGYKQGTGIDVRIDWPDDGRARQAG